VTLVSLVLVCMGVAATPIASIELQCTGAHQGAIKSSGQPVQLLGVRDVVDSGPVIQGAPMHSGRHQHHPLTLIKNIDDSTPDFYKALTTNERLGSCNIVFKDGNGHQAYKVTLTHARVVSLTHDTPMPQPASSSNTITIYEQLTLAYDKIQWTTSPQKTTTDTWATGSAAAAAPSTTGPGQPASTPTTTMAASDVAAMMAGMMDQAAGSSDSSSDSSSNGMSPSTNNEMTTTMDENGNTMTEPTSPEPDNETPSDTMNFMQKKRRHNRHHRRHM